MILLDIYTQVRRDLDAAIKEQTALTPEIQRFALNHERKELIIKNLCAEISNLERVFGPKATLEMRKKLVDGVTQMFISNAKLHKEQSLMSDIARNANPNKHKEEMSEILQEV